MAKPRRSFSIEQKLQIIQEADQQGVTPTLRKHNLSHSGYSTMMGATILQAGGQKL